MLNLSRREIKKGWWLEARSTIPCAVVPDGCLVVFDLAEVSPTLDANHPAVTRHGEKVWYFNPTKDREIAEQDGDRVYCNPQVLYLYFMR